MNVRLITLIASVLFCFTNGIAQSNWYNQDWSNSKINLEIDKTLNATKVLYVAAHPDDENTRLISYLVNGLHAEVAYLSMTNGGGGQNLIGEELGDELGLIREQELYAARRIDGGQQYFTSATDFGYSKSHEETFTFWGKEKILEEVVYRIRKFQPNVIITRFSPETEGLRSTHGHHTASAILALEAYHAASDPTRFPEQLNTLKVWQAQAIYWNTSYWSFGSYEKLDSVVSAQPDKYAKINVESFVSDLGQTCSEIASHSRSMHKSQGFGTMASYGKNFEYLELLSGNQSAIELLSPNTSFLNANNYAGLHMAQRATERKSEFILKGIDKAYRTEKLSLTQLDQLKKIWLQSLGLKVFLTADNQFIPTGKNKLELSLVHFSDTNIYADRILIDGEEHKLGERLMSGDLRTFEIEHDFKHAYTRPNVLLTIGGVEINIPLIYRTSDPVKGEIIQPVMVAQSIWLEIADEQLLARKGEEAQIHFKITALKDIVKNITINLDQDLHGIPDVIIIDEQNALKKGETRSFSLPANTSNASVIVNVGSEIINQSIKIIKYDHIPWIYKLSSTKVNIKQIDAEVTAKNIGYLMGAGDKVPEAITLLGANVKLINADIDSKELANFDAVVFGIRALNVIEDIDLHMDKFYEYASNGGTLVIQYNTSHRLKTEKIGPDEKKIELSRNRVTEENAVAKVVQDHLVLNSPNKISEDDWNNWVQERGLYFPEKWGSEYSAPIAWHDMGENDLTGSLLISKHGEGHFVYTGISFFRELPAGVNGAYRLWANILSL